MRVLGTQGGQVVGDRYIDITAIAQDRSRALDGITLIVRLHHELEHVRGLRRGRRRYRRRLPNVSSCSNEILCTAEPSPNTEAAADSAISQYAAPGYTATCRT